MTRIGKVETQCDFCEKMAVCAVQLQDAADGSWRQLSYCQHHYPSRVFADGYCARCSELSHSLTRMLEAAGVPTGAKDWQKDWGPSKIQELVDYKLALMRLVHALREGDANAREQALDNAEFFFKLHRKRYQDRLAKAQAVKGE